MNGRTVIFGLIGMLFTITAFGQISVVSSVPVNGAVDVPLSTTVSFTFSEPLDTSRHMGDDGLCIYFLTHDPGDSLQPTGVYFSEDLRTISTDLSQTANTDFVLLITAAFGQNGDTLSVPYPLCYTTAASHGDRTVSGTISYDEGPLPTGSIIGLLDRSPFSDNHGIALAGTVATNPNGSYTVPHVRPGEYWPVAARDGNHDGNMDSDADIVGFYDPAHTGQPQSFTVSGTDVGNINMVLTHLNHWTTARPGLDTAQAVAAGYGSDYHLVIIWSGGDSVQTNGMSRNWAYIYYSSDRQRSLMVIVDGTYVQVDTSNTMQIPSNMLDMPLDFIDSDAIMASAESHGGSLIRSQHNIEQIRIGSGNMYWYLPQNPSLIFWVAEYSWQISDTLWDSWRVFMDIHTGDVINVEAVKPLPIGSTAGELGLHSNYPNPFNPVTTVPFVLPRMTHVDLKVYDVTGREVATLVNGNLPAGAHSVQFDAGRLPAGVYFCRLKAGEMSSTKKMLLLK